MQYFAEHNAEVLNQVTADCYPYSLCTYPCEQANAFMSFYEQCPVLKVSVT